MKRHYQFNTSQLFSHPELAKHTAFHEAGHAAAIYLGNKQKQLPPVFFKIQIIKPDQTRKHFSAKVIDGQLIQSLPVTLSANLSGLSNNEQHSYQCAYEADIINLLVGPLAEAKYVSIKDDEIFTLNLINLQALNHYGGHSDIEKAYRYLEFFIANKEQREDKMLELFTQAYQFIDNHKNWACIVNLAHYILESDQSSISCKEAISIFDRYAA